MPLRMQIEEDKEEIYKSIDSLESDLSLDDLEIAYQS